MIFVSVHLLSTAIAQFSIKSNQQVLLNVSSYLSFWDDRQNTQHVVNLGSTEVWVLLDSSELVLLQAGTV